MDAATRRVTVVNRIAWMGTRTMLAACAIAAVLLWPSGDEASAQALTAGVSGRVIDSQGGVLPAATIRITNRATNVETWTGLTDRRGTYRALSLPIGTYDIRVELPGFKPVLTEGVALRLNQVVTVDATLVPGEMSATVVVRGSGIGQLDTQTSALGLVVTSELLRNLPMPSRSPLNLLALAGGVSAGGPATGLDASQLSINGSRTLNTEITVDGVSVLAGSTGTPLRLPSVEALREFKVLTSTYSAEYGRTSGGFVNVVVDSGTNEYRGGAYGYFRHEALNAIDYFRKLRDEPKPQDRYRQVGGRFGGPLSIPGMYDGRGRTFVFANYETLSRQQPSSQISTIPDHAFRTGDFSASPVTIVDPATGRPFPGNRIPASRIDAAASTIMSLLPAPNATGTRDAANGRQASNYVLNETLAAENHEATVRVDHHTGPDNRFFLRGTYYDLNIPSFSRIPGVLDPALGPTDTRGGQLAFGWTRAWSSALISEANIGYSRDDPRTVPPSLGVDVGQTLGIARSAFPATPRMTISGYEPLGLNANTYRRQLNNITQLSLAVTKGAERHAIKSGAQLRLNGFDVYNPGANFAGVYTFNGELTSPTRSAGNPVNALADFLLGGIQTAAYDLPQPTTNRRNVNVAAFLQDDWRLTPRLTLNLGVRYEYEAPVRIADNIYSRVDIATNRLLVAGHNASDTLNLEAARLNIGPRAGFAFTLGDRAVLRGGYGRFFSQTFSNLGGVVLYPGFTVRYTFPDLGVGVSQPFALSDGHPLASTSNVDPFAAERDATPQSPLSPGAQFGSVSPLPRTDQWNVGVQREIPGGLVVSATYVGSRGRHLPVVRPFNEVAYEEALRAASVGTAVALQEARPTPSVAGYTAYVNRGRSSYQSLQLEGSRQSTSALTFRASYTWSRSMDDGSGLFGFALPYGLDTGQFVNQFPDSNWSLSSFDRPHVFAAAASYALPGWRWINGIRLNTVVVARSGVPDTVTQTNLHPDAGQQRPDLIGGSLYAPEQAQEGTAIRYLLPVSDPRFPLAPVGPLFTGSGASRQLVLGFEGPGTLGRNTVREPGEFNVDVSVDRRIPVAGRLSVTLRAEVFNAFNRVNLNGPDTMLPVVVDPITGLPTFSSSTFGLITSSKPARFTQVVVRFDF